MTSLAIRNFLAIQEAKLELGDLTVLIGPQAHGKSIVAKLVHYFRRITTEVSLEVISGESSPQGAQKDLTAYFYSLFPRYAWANKSFDITYKDGDHTISVVRAGKRSDSPAQVVLGDSLLGMWDLAGNLAQAKLHQIGAMSEREQYVSLGRRRRALQETYNELDLPRFQPVFIPAGRSFFSNLQRNVFSFISSELEVDPLLAEFGRQYQYLKDSFTLASHGRGGISALRDSRIERVIRGVYIAKGTDEFIEYDKRRVKLMNSSSGQQEALPMLFMLSQWAFLSRPPLVGVGISIEEPEAHLFPASQREVALIIAATLNKSPSNKCLITTHSPYLLTAFNNLAFAGSLKERLPESMQAELRAIVEDQHLLKPGGLTAYKVENGGVQDLVEADTGLVNAQVIDEVSEEVTEQFDRLLELAQRTHTSTAGA